VGDGRGEGGGLLSDVDGAGVEGEGEGEGEGERGGGAARGDCGGPKTTRVSMYPTAQTP